MNKLKAFTLLESIITLLLMGIIISMVYVVYSFFDKNVGDYSKNTAEDIQVSLFYNRLKEEFYLSDKVIERGDHQFDIVFYNEEEVNYEFRNNLLIRKSSTSRDTLKVFQVKVERLFDDHVHREHPLIKTVFITASLYGEEAPLYLFKKYYPDNLISQYEY